MRREIISAIVIISLLVIVPNVYAKANVTRLHGWNGTAWEPVIVSNDGTLQVDFNLTQTKRLLPKYDNTYDIGSSNLRWRDLYTGANAYLATASGNVGIGTASPISMLDVSGNISVSGSIVSSIDGSTFYIDATNDRVGIGTTSPLSTLHVAGVGNFSQNFVIRTLLSCNTIDSTANGTLLCGSDTSGNSVWSSSGFTLTNTTANLAVGIGTSSPISSLDISGNISIAGTTNSSIDGSTFYIDATNNRVGIGTTNPNTTLHVVGNLTVNGNLLPNAQPTSGSTTQTITLVDSSITNGIYTTVAIGTDNLPIIIYGEFNGNFKVVHCGNIECSAGNTITTLMPGVGTSSTSDIAIAPDGTPVISFYQQDPASDIYVIKCGTITCSPNSSNTFTRVDEVVAHDSRKPAIAIAPDGLPVISYQNFTDSGNAQVRVIKCGNAQCSSGNTISNVDTGGGNFGLYNAIAIGADGLPIVAYKDHANGYTKVAKCGNIYCNVSNIITSVDTTNVGDNIWNIGIPPDGLPVIAYTDAVTYAVKVAKCGNIACSTGNTVTRVDTGMENGTLTHLAIAPDGLPIISYQNWTSAKFRVIKCGNAQCSSGNTISNVDTDGKPGYYSSIAIAPDGLPVLAEMNYSDSTGKYSLRVAKCADPSCNQTSGGSFSAGSNVGSTGQFFNNIYGAKYWGRQFQIAAFDVAEEYQVTDLTIGLGDVVSILSSTTVQKNQQPYDTQVLGVVSEQPAIRLGEWENEYNTRPITLNGRTPVKVTDENGPIYPGDLLTSSSKPGYAMKCPVETNEQKLKCFGAVIGKALEPLESGEGKILTLVTPHE